MLTVATGIAAHGWRPVAWWPIFPLFWVLVWGVVIFAVFRLARGRWHGSHTAEQVLAERYARGEINVEEYRERLSVLKGRTT
jgi:putative membrane protein